MTPPTTHPSARPRPLRSAAAIALALPAVVFLSVGADMMLDALEVYLPGGELMHETGLNLLALALSERLYRHCKGAAHGLRRRFRIAPA